MFQNDSQFLNFCDSLKMIHLSFKRHVAWLLVVLQRLVVVGIQQLRPFSSLSCTAPVNVLYLHMLSEKCPSFLQYPKIEQQRICNFWRKPVFVSLTIAFNFHGFAMQKPRLMTSLMNDVTVTLFSNRSYFPNGNIIFDGMKNHLCHHPIKLHKWFVYDQDLDQMHYDNARNNDLRTEFSSSEKII